MLQAGSGRVDSFLTRLQERASTCEYRELKDEMICDRLVLGITNENTRRRLLRELELTLSQTGNMPIGRSDGTTCKSNRQHNQ